MNGFIRNWSSSWKQIPWHNKRCLGISKQSKIIFSSIVLLPMASLPCNKNIFLDISNPGFTTRIINLLAIWPLDKKTAHLFWCCLLLIAWCRRLVWFCVCIPGQHWVFPPPTAIITTRSHGMLDTRRCKRSTGISAHLSSWAWRSSPRFWGRLSTHDPIHPKYVLWVCSLAILLLHLGDVALLKEIRDYPSTVRCGVIVLVAVVIPENLPG